MTAERKLQAIREYLAGRISHVYGSSENSSYARLDELSKIKKLISEIDETQ